MIKKIKQARDNSNVLLQLLQTCLKHLIASTMNFSFAKLNIYDFDSLSIKFTCVYFNFRKQKTKVSSTFNDYLNIMFVVPQGSIAGPLFYNCDTFFQTDTSEFFSSPEDNTPFASGQNHKKLQTLCRSL